MSKEKFRYNETGLMIFSKSVVSQFQHVNKHLRYGQAFHQFMKLERCVQDKTFADRLYNEPREEKAKAMIASRTDSTQ